MLGRHPESEPTRRDVLCDDRTGGDERSLADGYVRQHSRVRPDGDVVLEGRSRQVDVLPERVGIVREDRIRAEEHPVTDLALRRDVHAGLNAYLGADLDPAVQHRLRPEDDVVTDGRVFTYHRVVARREPGPDIDVTVDGRPGPDGRFRTDDSGLGGVIVHVADGRTGVDDDVLAECCSGLLVFLLA
ncbi:transferase [Halodesulfurarchaeum formicicum]|uniref:Transferase n=1 Tax=Halodesulfurarchaeum formicicum TaxID=1873524 RepID=A0A1J1ABE5_9EURY|nr:transferase [Halodesulfurarchaeum formicicum]